MRSKRKLRFVTAVTPPIDACVIVKADLNGTQWAQAKAEAMLQEQIKAQTTADIGNLAILRKMGVYTVEYNEKTGHYVHRVFAPDGVEFRSVETVPRWWEAADTLKLDRIPNGNRLTIAMLPAISMTEWRRSSWPDRPHP